jgi:hypothetical protein
MKRLFALILTLGLIGSVAYAHNGMENRKLSPSHPTRNTPR